ncbi:MAG: polyprenyl synthetase family protein [Desulfobacterales bacterium]|nr:polyprenyl synthetase family protein [Desulfobacterales bacterium]
MKDLKDKILAMVKSDRADIESTLKENLNPYLDLVGEIAEHILFSGGKRLRPLLMILSARICGYNGDYDKILSIIFEYLHAATLLHDDLVDEASIRRGKPAAHTIWGNSTAVLVGDFLLARSLSIAVGTENTRVIKIIADITENMSQGEIHQLIRKGSLELSEEEYMEVIRRKTAVLIQGACTIGAIIADAPCEQERTLSEYGLNLGIAFQMVDDLLDYISDTSVLGKAIGADLREGKLTLPVIYSLKKADSKNRLKMEEIIKNKNFSIDEFETLIEMLNKFGGLEYTEKKASEYIKKAKDALSFFEPSETREILLNVADYALKRSA